MKSKKFNQILRLFLTTLHTFVGIIFGLVTTFVFYLFVSKYIPGVSGKILGIIFGIIFGGIHGIFFFTIFERMNRNLFEIYDNLSLTQINKKPKNE